MPEIPAIDTVYLKETLLRLIRIDSALPYEERLAAFIADEIRSFGVEPELNEVTPGRPNVCATIGSGRGFLVFSGHSDTVPAAAGWETDPLEPVERDGRLYGLGAINMKSGLACMLTAFKALAGKSRSFGLSGGRVGIAVTVDQEGHSIGSRALLKTPYGRCDAMLHAEHFFGDSADDYLPLAVTGKVLYKLTVKGRAAHGFRPHKGGINAVTDASRIVAALEKLPLGSHADLGRGTQCVLKIDGGYREYSIVVPENCEVIITRLIVPGETIDSARDDMLALIDQLDLESEVTVEMVSPSYEPYFLDLSCPIATTFAESYRSVMGFDPHFAGHTGVVDGNVFAAEGGIPTVVFGPKGGLHHRPGEYVELSSLAPVAEIYLKTALEFLAEE